METFFYLVSSNKGSQPGRLKFPNGLSDAQPEAILLWQREMAAERLSVSFLGIAVLTARAVR
jgi:hypothetical protein